MTDLRHEMRRIVESMEDTLQEKVTINIDLVKEAFDILGKVGIINNPEIYITESKDGEEKVLEMIEALDSAVYLMRSSLG